MASFAPHYPYATESSPKKRISLLTVVKITTAVFFVGLCISVILFVTKDTRLSKKEDLEKKLVEARTVELPAKKLYANNIEAWLNGKFVEPICHEKGGLFPLSS